MNSETTTTTQESQFVLRRLEEALRFFGRETDPHWFWILVLMFVLAAGFAYVIWQYKRDSQSVGWAWATFLGFLRCCVYVVLATVFLLPAIQTWDKTEMRSKVVLAGDVSLSMGNRDDLPTESSPAEKLPTRQDKVIQFLTANGGGFLKSLQEKNPVFYYRFGSKVDENVQVCEGGKTLSATEWADWLKPALLDKMPPGLSEDEQKQFSKRQTLLKQLLTGTNLPESLLDVFNRESNNMVQGIVVFSDGRNSGRPGSSTQFSAEVEFGMEAAALGVPHVMGRKPELEEGDYVLQGRVPRDKREPFLGKEHASEKATIHVVKKPLRVLLFAGGPTRDYQFVRSMLVREVDAGRAQLSICLQTKTDGVVQDVPPERFLASFPSKLGDEASDTADRRYYNLSQYDLIMAFDPEWQRLTAEQMNVLEKWVNLQAGGLIFVAGPINTFELARLGNRDQLKPILNLYPVILQDSRLLGLPGSSDRPTGEPWRLNFPGATAEMEFLKLDEEGNDALAGWEEFFTGLKKGEATKET